MFVRDRSPFRPTLARAHFDDDLAVASINVDVVYRADSGGWRAVTEAVPRVPTDPPAADRIALWKGVSVTAFGQVLGPRQPPYVRPVVLRIGGAERRLAVSGDRVWVRGARSGELVPSEAAPFDAMPLGWDRAFGGTVTVRPGYLPGTELPHPGGTMSHPQNPAGRGWALDSATATGAPLPNVEYVGALLGRFGETPEPAGIAPCPELVALRVQPVREQAAEGSTDDDDGRALAAFEQSLRAQHHATGRLIVAELSPGSVVRLDGVGTEPIELCVPASPVCVRVDPGNRERVVAGRLRSLHIDADARLVRAVFGHALHYDPRRAPRVALVTGASA